MTIGITYRHDALSFIATSKDIVIVYIYIHTYIIYILATSQPHYLSKLVTAYKPTRGGMRSEAQRRLAIPTGLKSSFGGRTFTRASESVWNDLPENIRTISTLGTFKSKLKTHYFSTAFCV